MTADVRAFFAVRVHVRSTFLPLPPLTSAGRWGSVGVLEAEVGHCALSAVVFNQQFRLGRLVNVGAHCSINIYCWASRCLVEAFHQSGLGVGAFYAGLSALVRTRLG